MLTRKFFARGTDPVLSSTSPADHVQYAHQGYREFPTEKEAKAHVTANKAAQTRAENADTESESSEQGSGEGQESAAGGKTADAGGAKTAGGKPGR